MGQDLESVWRPRAGEALPATDDAAAAVRPEPARRATDRGRFARGWMPEAIGAVLAVLTVGLGPQVARFLDHVATQARDASAAPWFGAHSGGWLDIAIDPAPPGAAAGVTVDWVGADGASAGILQRGDLISALDGRPVASLPALRGTLATMPAGTVVQLSIVRDGTTRAVDVRLSGMPPLLP